MHRRQVGLADVAIRLTLEKYFSGLKWIVDPHDITKAALVCRGLIMRSRTATILISAWATSAVGSLYVMAKYEATPGRAPSSHRVASTRPTPTSDKPTLQMFAHPRCPCSVASVEELSVLLARCGDRVHVEVLFYQPSIESAEWSHTALWRDAAALPGVTVSADIDARRARQCGAQTSGQVLLYSQAGKLIYEGGITGSRGHVGDNDALNAIEHLLVTPPAPTAPPVHAPVFGCAIYATQSADVATP